MKKSSLFFLSPARIENKMSSFENKKYLLVRCDKPIVSFCVISDRAVHFDAENLDLEEGTEIKFYYPEEEDHELGKRKRGRKPVKKTYTGVIVQKSGFVSQLLCVTYAFGFLHKR